MTSLFPSILPDAQDEQLTPEDVKQLFDEDWKTMRKAIMLIREDKQNELPVNGKSTKAEVASWMASNMTAEGLQVYKNEVEKSNE